MLTNAPISRTSPGHGKISRGAHGEMHTSVDQISKIYVALWKQKACIYKTDLQQGEDMNASIVCYHLQFIQDKSAFLQIRRPRSKCTDELLVEYLEWRSHDKSATNRRVSRRVSSFP